MKLIRIILASLVLLLGVVTPAAAKTSYSLFFSTGPTVGAGFGLGGPMFYDAFTPMSSFGFGYNSAFAQPLFTPAYPFQYQSYPTVPLSPAFSSFGYPFNSYGYGYNGSGGYNNSLFSFPNTYNGYANYNGSTGGLYSNNYLNGYGYNTGYASTQCYVYVSCSCSCSR